MLFYWGLITLLLFFLFNKHFRKGYVVSIVIITLVSILRFDVGFDYPAYYGYLWPSYDKDHITNLEPLSRLIYEVANVTGGAPMVFIYFGCLTFLFVYLGIKKTKVPNWALLVYISLFWLESFNIIRQSLGIAIIIYAYSYIEEKKLIRFLSLCTLATLFHYSAAICVLFYLIYHYLNKWYITILLSLSLLVLSKILFDYMLLMDIYSSHVEYDGPDSGGKLMFFFILLFCLTLYLTFLNRKKVNNYVKHSLPILFFSFWVFFIMTSSVFAYRICLYFAVAYIYVIAELARCTGKQTKQLLAFTFVGYFLLMLYISDTNKNRSPYIPYQSIIFVDDATKFRGVY